MRKIDSEVTALRRNSRGVVVLYIIGRVVMHVDSVPVWVVSFVECPSIRIELIREDQSVFMTVLPYLRQCGLRRVAVYQTWEVAEVGDLPCSIDIY